MDKHELATYMKRPEPSGINSPRDLPLEIMISTIPDCRIRDGLWKTRVTGIDPDGQEVTIQSCATLDPPDEQHGTFVGNYRSMGYEIAKQPGSSAVRRQNTYDKLKKLLEDSGLDYLL